MKYSSLFPELFIYLKLLIRKWVFVLAFIVDIIGIVVQFIIPINFSPFVFGLIAISGFLIAGFEVYRDNQKLHQSNIIEYEQLLETLTTISPEISIPLMKNGQMLKRAGITKENIKPQLKISTIEGSEYSFAIIDPATIKRTIFSNQNLPDFNFTINVTLENVGNISLQIIGISSSLGWGVSGFGVYPLVAHKSEFIGDDGENITFPIELPVNHSIFIHHKAIIYCGPTDSEFMYAASLRKELSPDLINKNVEISAKTFLPQNGSIHEFTEKFIVSAKPLRDLLFTYWKKINREDLVNLAIDQKKSS